MTITVTPAPDTTKPTIDVLNPPPGSTPNDNNRDIKATVKDEGSDLMKEDIRLFVDGKEESSFTYNPKNDRLVFDKMDRFGKAVTRGTGVACAKRRSARYPAGGSVRARGRSRAGRSGK